MQRTREEHSSRSNSSRKSSKIEANLINSWSKGSLVWLGCGGQGVTGAGIGEQGKASWIRWDSSAHICVDGKPWEGFNWE